MANNPAIVTDGFVFVKPSGIAFVMKIPVGVLDPGE